MSRSPAGSQSRLRARRIAPCGLLAGLLLAVAIAIAAASVPAPAPNAPGEPRRDVSLLAVGDTGSEWRNLPSVFEGQLGVAAGLRQEQHRSPVDALLLLGDLAYPAGLSHENATQRIGQNLVAAYCGFVELAGPLSHLLRSRCSRPAPPGFPVFAVVGNHDIDTAESLSLLRHYVPQIVSNWSMPRGPDPEVRELAGGLSLILLHSEHPWGAEAQAKLSEALRSSKGPWRAIAGHRPPITGHPQLREMVANAIRDSGRPVHLYLAGHLHRLLALRGIGDAPGLTIVAGSGSRAEFQDSTEYGVEGLDFAATELGFARVDAPVDERGLLVTLFRARASAVLAAFLEPTPVAQYRIAPDATVERNRLPDALEKR